MSHKPAEADRGNSQAVGQRATDDDEASGLDQLDHVAIRVQSIDEAVAWYRTMFRCEVSYQDRTWAMLQFANVKLALVVEDEHPAHLGFATEQASGFGELVRHRDGTRSVYVEDPSGNAVELLQID